MKDNFTIFYSWQSDKKKSSNFISSSLEKAIKEVNKNKSTSINEPIKFDRDTRNESGSPAIAQTIFNKIEESDIFVCDVSLINNSLINRIANNRLTPNPNVMVELGYAINLLGWERIICVNNSNLGDNESLPFDIRGHRISTFNGCDSNEKKKMISIFKSAIISVLEGYENIVERHKKQSVKGHDIKTFNVIKEIITENNLNEEISTVVNSLYYNNYFFNKWSKIIEHCKETSNHFINTSVNEQLLLLVKHIEEFRSLSMKHIVDVRNISPTILELEDSGIDISEDDRRQALQNERFFFHNEPYQNEEYEDVHRRRAEASDELYKVSEKIKSTYKTFIQFYKKEILA